MKMGTCENETIYIGIRHQWFPTFRTLNLIARKIKMRQSDKKKNHAAAGRKTSNLLH